MQGTTGLSRPLWLSLVRVGVALATFLIACFAFLVLRDGSLLLSVLAIFITGLLAIRLHRIVQQELRPEVSAVWRYAIVGGIGGVGAVLLAIWYVGGRADGFALFGFALVYLGLGLLLEQVRQMPTLHARWFVGILVVLVALIVLALVAVVAGAEWAIVVAALAFVLTPTGFALVSELALRAMEGTPASRAVILGALGLMLLGVGLALAWAFGLGLPFALGIGAFLVVVMIGLAARSIVDVIFVAAAAAVVWTLGHQSAALPVQLKPSPGDQVFVAIGDSFISGEGAEEFYEGTNEPAVNNTCRRAPTAYPPLLTLERRDDVPARLRFLACSGAKAPQIAEQLAQLPSNLGTTDDVEFVLLSVGGNDALFGTVGKACLLPIDCTELEEAWLANLDGVAEQLEDVYAEVRAELPDAPVYIVPYPVPIRESSCSYSAFTDDEHEFLDRFTRALNATVASAAREADFRVVDTMPGALERRKLRLCDGRPGDVGVNFLAANSVVGTLEQSVNPTNWIHNSMHPNARGHEAMRVALVEWLDSDADTTTDPALEEGATSMEVDEATGPCAGRVGAELDSCSWDWVAREFSAFVLSNAWVLIPAVAGAWLVALQLVRGWRMIYGSPPPTRDPSGASG